MTGGPASRTHSPRPAELCGGAPPGCSLLTPACTSRGGAPSSSELVLVAVADLHSLQMRATCQRRELRTKMPGVATHAAAFAVVVRQADLALKVAARERRVGAVSILGARRAAACFCVNASTVCKADEEASKGCVRTPVLLVLLDPPVVVVRVVHEPHLVLLRQAGAVSLSIGGAPRADVELQLRELQ